MKELFAKTPRQLDICLRLLHAEGIKFSVQVYKTDKKKVYYGITMMADDKTCEVVSEKYDTMTL